jgi:uncharacterized membrane protein YjgN (DUF898 family)
LDFSFTPFLILVLLFAYSMLLVTIMVDKSISYTFVVNSMNLPIKIARNHDDEEVGVIFADVHAVVAISINTPSAHCMSRRLSLRNPS